MVGVSSEMTKSDALKLEYRVKQVPASKKYLELTKKENKMTEKLKKDLQAVSKALNSLAQKIEKMQKEVDKQAQPTNKSKPKAVKKAPVKKAAVKKTGQVTTADTVLAIINGSKKGVNTETLKKKTGYNQKKIANLIYKLKKQGKIKSADKGCLCKSLNYKKGRITSFLFFIHPHNLTKGLQMAEKLDPKELVRFQELLMANSIIVDSLTQLLMEKGIITNEEFFAKMKQVQAEYHKKSGQSQ